MLQHELYFYKQTDASDALSYVKNTFTSNVTLVDGKVTFSTLYTIQESLQEKILKRINSYKTVFNMSEV